MQGSLEQSKLTENRNKFFLEASWRKDLQVYIHFYLQKGSHKPETTWIRPTNYQETNWIYFYLQNIALCIDIVMYIPQ